MSNALRDVGVNIILSLPLIGAYALFALGIVVIYRASRVLNLAHGAMATLPGYVAYAAAPRLGAPLGILLGIASVARSGYSSSGSSCGDCAPCRRRRRRWGRWRCSPSWSH